MLLVLCGSINGEQRVCVCVSFCMRCVVCACLFPPNVNMPKSFFVKLGLLLLLENSSYFLFSSSSSSLYSITQSAMPEWWMILSCFWYFFFLNKIWFYDLRIYFLKWWFTFFKLKNQDFLFWLMVVLIFKQKINKKFNWLWHTIGVNES